jgi:GNAT superfamily N-acetyltransferase
MTFRIRPATSLDVPLLETLIAESARGLSRDVYTEEEIEAAITHVFGVDSELVEDGTYFTVTDVDGGTPLACGGWSRRKTLFGGDRFAARESGLLDPASEPAKIRAFFVHPAQARRGIGRALLQHCESEAARHGFTRIEMMATLPGVKLYGCYGYAVLEECLHQTPCNTPLRFMRMRKAL